ncbi:N2227-like protein [Crucibulum laeve]|uniref:N2227-like protein n=1 Tax=Crucibulum laeve TaxID=68775 RepID=A0A5C3MJC5_9AGAR|nr:N2227-like protein [Crucibulum laeve]
MRKAYSTLGRTHKRIGFKIRYPEKLDRLKHVTDLNATIAEGIAELAAEQFSSLSDSPEIQPSSADLGRTRESLKHFVRDWSEEGAQERNRIFAPILDVLRQVDSSERSSKKVLVPGSGLGRLAWEISQLGYDTTANEFSFFMTLAFRFLLSSATTASTNQHILRPYSHWFSHQRTNDSLFRSIAFPDAVPRLSATFHLAEQDFLTMPIPPVTKAADNSMFWSKAYASDDLGITGGYDFVVTLFFIDTAINAFATMEHMYHLLRPGGTWINLGPLLWTGGAQAKVELSLEEVLQAAEEIGFVIQTGDSDLNTSDVEARKTVECEYTGDRNAMMRWIYKAEFWVARKFK